LVVAPASFSRSIRVIDIVGRSSRYFTSPPSFRRLLQQQQKMMSTDSMPPSPSSQLENNEDNVGLSDIGQQSSTADNNSNLGRGYSNNNNNNNNSDNDTTMKGWKERIDISIAKSRKIRGSNYVQLSTIDIQAMEPRCRTVVFRGFLKSIPNYDEDYSKYYGDCVMKMITDKRSNKVHETASQFSENITTTRKHNDVAEMVWWFAKSSEQYRVRGKLHFIGSSSSTSDTTIATRQQEQMQQQEEGGGETEKTNNYFTIERKQQWGNLSDMAREQFYWKYPGLEYEGQPSNVPKGGRDVDGTVLPPPDNFLLMLLYPTRVDYLRLTDNYHQIDEWRHNDTKKEEHEEGKSKMMMQEEDDRSAVNRWVSMRVNP
jgi:hypothetical protein